MNSVSPSNILPMPRAVFWGFGVTAVLLTLILAPELWRCPAPLPEYELVVPTAKSPPAPWQSATLGTVRVPPTGLFNVMLRPRRPVGAPITVRAFINTAAGESVEWLQMPAHIASDGSVSIQGAPPASWGRRQEITFLVTRQGADTSLAALRRSSSQQRLLHVSVVGPRNPI